MLKKLLILPPILLAVGVLVFVISQKQPPERKPPSEQARQVRVIEARPVILVPRALGFGEVRPDKTWSATAQVSGEITFVHPDLKKGAVLQAGTEIIGISKVDYELAIREAQANIRSAEATRTELDVSRRNTELSLNIEERSLAVRETELARKQDLMRRGTVAQSAVDQEFRDTLSQRKKVQDLKNSLNLIPTQIAVQTERIAVYQAALEQTRLNLERTRIRLPFNARIAEVDVETTQYAQVGQVLAVADSMDIAEIEAQFSIDPFRAMVQAAAGEATQQSIDLFSFANLVEQMGLSLTVRLGSGANAIEWAARFSRISDTVDPKTRTIGVIAAVDGAYAKTIPGQRPPLTKGMFVEIEIHAKPLKDRIVIPRSAVHDGHVYIQNAENRLEIRPVKTGLVQGDLASPLEGVAAGDRVIVSDLSPAIEGMLLVSTTDEDLSDRLARNAAGSRPGT
ncbi:MAG: HlyD family efflux transporter periplasmic adaptor subunit [Rhodospirillales bacterium]|nr:HlyD family efflux transporter periplasmic adaptor subunit [Rhodospirillales bacterium]